jgi:hypothetical protein
MLDIVNNPSMVLTGFLQYPSGALGPMLKVEKSIPAASIWKAEDLLDEFPKPTELIDRALQNLVLCIEKNGADPMDSLSLTSDEFQFLGFCPESSIMKLYDHMQTKGYLTDEGSGMDACQFSITPAGWDRVEKYREERPDSRQAFVAMWADKEMDPVYEKGIKAGIEDAGYECKLIKVVEHNGEIDDLIKTEIRRSLFIVADITAGRCRNCVECNYIKDKANECADQVKPRAGVYFEAGFAIGLGKQVIWTVRDDQAKEMHFDTRQYNHIIYDKNDIEMLRKRILSRIVAVFGQGPVIKS